MVYLERSDNPARKTAYDLIAVRKGDRLINMDSQAPNRAVEEWLRRGGLFPDPVLVKPEAAYGNSRIDFYIETDRDKIYVEVKGVTLEEDGIVLFPDAPSERAVKHVEELAAAVAEGYQAYVLFVVQMRHVRWFTPNRKTHPAFAQALERAARAGVKILAYDCLVKPDEMTLAEPVEVRLGDGILERMPKPLLKWYDANRRILPWREDPAPYKVWVSEIMLQQTRVEAVKPYFERFMKTLPDVRALARADENTLLKLWEGLGYYNRVRNLQSAALQIEEQYGGRIPDTYGELLKLKGIGSYTAGAIASIAFGRPCPAVDGNVLRVIARLRGDGRDIRDPQTRKEVERDLARVMPEDRPGDLNQALMEIGAMVCIPNGAPRCGQCPLAALCTAYREKATEEYPKKSAAGKRRVEEKTILVIRDENRTAIRKRPSGGLLAGMYEFPSLEGYRSAEEVAEYLKEAGIHAVRIQPLRASKHVFTHREWHMRAYMVRVDELEKNSGEGACADWLFVEPAETEERYPIPSAFAAYMGYLNIRFGKEKMERRDE